MTEQPKALRVAEALEQQFPSGTAQHFLDGEAARLLREQHAEIEALRVKHKEALETLEKLVKLTAALDKVDGAARHVRFVSSTPLDEDAWESLHDALDDVDFVKLAEANSPLSDGYRAAATRAKGQP